MSCELRTLISFFILLAMSLKLKCRSFTGMSQREAAGNSEESSFSEIFYAFEFKETNPNSNRIRRSIKLDASVEPSGTNTYENLPKLSSEHIYELPFTDNENTQPRSFHKRANDVEPGFQGDAPAYEGRVMPGKIYASQSGSSSKSRDMWLALHKVRCSEQVMTLTTAGREYTHIYVDRVNAAPLPLLQVPSNCGFSVRVTWKDLVLRLPYDACFITKENGSYVLSLLWWDNPIKISCPMTPVISTPSVFCSDFGMVIAIKGAREAAEKHRVKVNVRMLPLLSETCAYRLHSPPEVVLLHTTFNARCVTVTDNKNILVIILDGKQFTISCPVPHHLPQFGPYLHSPLFHQPLQPGQEQMPFIPFVPSASASAETSKPAVIQSQPSVSQFYNVKHPQYPFYQIPSIYQPQKPPGHFYPMFPHHPLLPPAGTPSIQQKLPPPLDQIPQMPQNPILPPPYYSPFPISCPPFPEKFCSQFPVPGSDPLYHEPSTDSQPSTPTLTSFPEPTSQPLTPAIMQESNFSQLPIFPPAPPGEPSKISPLLHCARNRLIANLPSATMDSIKVRDTRTNTWISIALVSEACNYNLHSRGGRVVLSSPLPSCHTKQMSPTVLALLVRYWDSSQERLRTLQLQCHFPGDPSTQPKDPSVPVKTFIPDLTDAPARTPPQFQVVCSSHHMNIKLPPGPTSGIFVQAPSSEIQTEVTSILEAPSHCGYSVKIDKDGAINIHLPYTSCHMTQTDGEYRIILKYQTSRGRPVESLLSCQASLSQECSVMEEQRLVCGTRQLSSSECHRRGCCYCGVTQRCYYPMDECTMDRHFIFSVRSSSMDPPLSPATLVTAGESSCKPERITADFALFKIPLDECGVHRYEVGKTIIYMVEILNRVQPISLNYGTISRDSPVRLLVECRYVPGSVVSVGYLVKSPSLGPSIKAQGVFGVQLRIAEDEHYNNFYPQYHQPLQMLLGKPLYLEVRLLNPPDPTTMLLVHYCVAYPRSANSAWILIYDGCPNFLDQTPTHAPPATPAEALTNHVRRFTITTFQFLSEDSSLQADEEIYFMCSTEVCLPSDGPCVEGCFGDPSDMKS